MYDDTRQEQLNARLDIELLNGQAEGWGAASVKVLERAYAAFGREEDDEADLLREIAAQLKQESDKLAGEVTKKRAEYDKKWPEEP